MKKVAPLELHHDSVRSEWIDYNGHMNVAYYVLAFDYATDTFFDHIGLDRAYREGTGNSTFAVDAHVTYQREVAEGDPLRFSTQLIGFDQKRLHFFHRMYHAEQGFLSATAELLSLHIDMGRRRVAPMPTAILDRLEALWAEHRQLPDPEELGKVIKRPKFD